MVDNGEIIEGAIKGIINRQILKEAIERVVKGIYRKNVVFPQGYCKVSRKVLDNLEFIEAWNSYNRFEPNHVEILKAIFDF